jgi:circadian clock protein KaiC
MLEREAPIYGAARRRLEVVKLRGVGFRGGYHDFNILRGGLVVYPRLIAADHKRRFNEGECLSGVPEIDSLLGGGLDRGSSTVILGPAGAGKSSLAAQYACEAAHRGEKTAMFIFDESRRSLFARSASLKLDVRGGVDKGLISAQQIDPAELPPGEFASLVRRAVEHDGASIVVIDSLNGYLNAMPEERYLALHLHELLSFLSEQGVASIMVVAQHGLIGNMTSSIDVSYLADAVLMLRYYEADGEIHKAISVLKKRSGAHETAIRDFALSSAGIKVGPPLRQFRGILSGVPIVNTNGDERNNSETGRLH